MPARTTTRAEALLLGAAFAAALAVRLLSFPAATAGGLRLASPDSYGHLRRSTAVARNFPRVPVRDAWLNHPEGGRLHLAPRLRPPRGRHGAPRLRGRRHAGRGRPRPGGSPAPPRGAARRPPLLPRAAGPFPAAGGPRRRRVRPPSRRRDLEPVRARRPPRRRGAPPPAPPPRARSGRGGRAPRVRLRPEGPPRRGRRRRHGPDVAGSRLRGGSRVPLGLRSRSGRARPRSSPSPPPGSRPSERRRTRPASTSRSRSSRSAGSSPLSSSRARPPSPRSRPPGPRGRSRLGLAGLALLLAAAAAPVAPAARRLPSSAAPATSRPTPRVSAATRWTAAATSPTRRTSSPSSRRRAPSSGGRSSRRSAAPSRSSLRVSSSSPWRSSSGDGDAADRRLLALFGGVLLLMNLSQQRNVYYLAPFAALAVAEALARIAPRGALRPAGAALAAAALLVALPGLPHYARVVRYAGGPGDRPRGDAPAPSRDLEPPPADPAALPQPAPGSVDGVFGPWSAGHFVTALTGYPAAADPFGYGWRRQARLFTTTDDDEAERSSSRPPAAAGSSRPTCAPSSPPTRPRPDGRGTPPGGDVLRPGPRVGVAPARPVPRARDSTRERPPGRATAALVPRFRIWRVRTATGDGGSVSSIRWRARSPGRHRHSLRHRPLERPFPREVDLLHVAALDARGGDGRRSRAAGRVRLPSRGALRPRTGRAAFARAATTDCREDEGERDARARAGRDTRWRRFGATSPSARSGSGEAPPREREAGRHEREDERRQRDRGRRGAREGRGRRGPTARTRAAGRGTGGRHEVARPDREAPVPVRVSRRRRGGARGERRRALLPAARRASGRRRERPRTPRRRSGREDEEPLRRVAEEAQGDSPARATRPRRAPCSRQLPEARRRARDPTEQGERALRSGCVVCRRRGPRTAAPPRPIAGRRRNGPRPRRRDGEDRGRARGRVLGENREAEEGPGRDVAGAALSLRSGGKRSAQAPKRPSGDQGVREEEQTVGEERRPEEEGRAAEAGPVGPSSRSRAARKRNGEEEERESVAALQRIAVSAGRIEPAAGRARCTGGPRGSRAPPRGPAPGALFE